MTADGRPVGVGRRAASSVWCSERSELNALRTLQQMWSRLLTENTIRAAGQFLRSTSCSNRRHRTLFSTCTSPCFIFLLVRWVFFGLRVIFFFCGVWKRFVCLFKLDLLLKVSSHTLQLLATAIVGEYSPEWSYCWEYRCSYRWISGVCE